MIKDIKPLEGITREDEGSLFYSGRVYRVGEKEYPSLTYMLGETADRKYLNQWKERVGFEEAERIGQEAAARGTMVHSILESQILNRGSEVSPYYWGDGSVDEFVDPVLSFVQSNWLDGIEPVLMEDPIWCEGIGFAGTVDFLGARDDSLILFDWKTSSKKKYKSQIKDYFLQLTGYSLAIRERYEVDVDQCCIVLFFPGGYSTFPFRPAEYEEEFLSRVSLFYGG